MSKTTQLHYLPEVTTVVPNYNQKAFTVYFKDDKDPLSLNFSNYLLWLTMRDDSLAEYMINHHASSSFNQMIGDLYDIGFPVEEKINTYFVDMQEKLDPALLTFLEFMRNGFDQHFGNPQDDDVTDY